MKIKKITRILFVLVICLGIYAISYPAAQLTGKVTYKIPSAVKTVALTFDDGPNGNNTELILDILDIYGVKATFFVIGKNVEQYPELTREIVWKGHRLANHSYSHSWWLPFMPKKIIAQEVRKTENIIYKTTGINTKLFRPPHGLRTPWMIQELQREGYTVYTWDDMSNDYNVNVSSKSIASSILRRVKPGSIIILHDGLNTNHKASRGNTIIALSRILDKLTEQGYTFTKL